METLKAKIQLIFWRKTGALILAKEVGQVDQSCFPSTDHSSDYKFSTYTLSFHILYALILSLVSCSIHQKGWRGRHQDEEFLCSKHFLQCEYRHSLSYFVSLHEDSEDQQQKVESEDEEDVVESPQVGPLPHVQQLDFVYFKETFYIHCVQN